MSIEFACPSCQKKYVVKDDAAGKKAKCGRCDASIQVPKPAPEPQSEIDDEFNLAPLPGDDLSADFPAVSAATEPALAPVSSHNRCPSCDAPLSPNAVLCVSCGFNLKTGKQLAVEESEEQPPTKKKKRRKKKADNSDEKRGTLDPVTLIRGTALSLAGALIGCVLWCAFFHFTGYDFNLIALLVGFLAGAGMSVGHEDDDGSLAGVIAATFALAGIFAAKVMIFHMFFGSLGADIDQETIDREIVVEQVMEEKQREQRSEEDEDPTDVPSDQTLDEDTYDALYAEAEEDVAAMSDEQVRMRMRVAELVETLLQREIDDLDDQADEDAYEQYHREIIEEVEAMTDDQVQQRLKAIELADLLLENKFNELNEDPDEETFDSLREEVRTDVDSMTPEQVQRRLAAIEMAQLSDGDEVGDDGMPLIPPIPLLFFVFGISGIILTCMAAGEAYTIASGKMTD